MSGLWAALPVKAVENAKQRLAPALSPDERQALFKLMVEHALETLAAVDRLDGILVVSSDPFAISLARRHNARVLPDPTNAGHTEASTLGAKTLAAEGATGMIQIPGDLPALMPDDINAVLDVHGEAPAITLAPSSDELGSNAVACSPPDLLPLRFGDNSFFPHIERARSLGVEPTIVRRDGIALDIDTVDDIKDFLETGKDGRTYRYLIESGIAERLGKAGAG